MVQNVNDNFVLQVEGTGASLNENELLGGAKINMIFHQRFNYQIQKVKFILLFDLGNKCFNLLLQLVLFLFVEKSYMVVLEEQHFSVRLLRRILQRRF